MKIIFKISLLLAIIYIVFAGGIVHAADDNVIVRMTRSVDGERKNISITLETRYAKRIVGNLIYDSDVIKCDGIESKGNWVAKINDKGQFIAETNGEVNSEMQEMAVIKFSILDNSEDFTTQISLENIIGIKINSEGNNYEEFSIKDILKMDVPVVKEQNNQNTSEDTVEIGEVVLVDVNGNEITSSDKNYEAELNQSFTEPDEDLDLGEDEESVKSDDNIEGDTIEESEGEDIIIDIDDEYIKRMRSLDNSNGTQEGNTSQENSQNEVSKNETTDESGNKTVEKSTENKNTIANKILPKTGAIRVILPIVLGAGLIVIAIVVLNKSKKMK